MTKKTAPKLRPDAAEIAFRVMQEAVGDAPKTDPTNKSAKNAEAAKRGKKGGKARAANLTGKELAKIGRKGSTARWKESG